MTKDKKILICLSSIIFAVLFLALFIPIANSRVLATLILVPSSVLVCLAIRKRSILSKNRHTVLLLMTIIGGLWIMILYLTGIKFGFYRAVYTFGFKTVLSRILPIVAGIISVEIIRSVIRAQDDKAADVLCYLMCVASDVLMATNFKQISSFNSFMELAGLTLLPSLTANLLYHFISKKFGASPIVAYRLIITLYPFIIPILPSTPDALVAMGSMIVPLLIFAFISALFEKKKVTHKKTTLISYICIGAASVVMISIVMIVSCQFSVGSLVIGSGSMQGELNIGDIAVYTNVEDKSTIETGDVLVFSNGSSRIIHRVIEIENAEDGRHYFTKGDANEDADIGFITDEDIVGVVKFKLPYFGYPSVLLRRAFAR